ncbi:MAG: DnaJ domain-containing protein [Myxococcota bacterium]
MGSAHDKQRDEQVPRLAPGWEAQVADLSPEQGFLLSRIDGVTPWGVLRTIGGLPPEQVDAALECWQKDGLLEVEGSRIPSQETAGARTVVPGPSGRAGEVDPSLDLSAEIQQQVLEFEQRLERPYHEILGVRVDADTRTIKRAYFGLSKLYHPDRYFQKDVGSFGERLDRVFKKVALAYELMMDPTTREELQRSFQAAPPPEVEAPPTPAAERTERPTPMPQSFTKREWLNRMRKRFKIPEELLAERRFRARELAEAARVAKYQAQWNDAASAIRLAIAFDPWNNDYKELFAEIQVEVNQMRAKKLLEEASGAFDSRSCKEALALYEEVIAYRPADATAHHKAAQLALELENLTDAREYAERACELAPHAIECCVTLARVLRSQGLKERAREVLEEAREMDPQNREVLDELTKLRRRSGRSSGGKR